MSKKKCVVIGMGLLGTQHADRLHAHDTTTVAAVCDMAEAKARGWAEAHGCNWYTEAGAMLAAEKPDLVVVATQDPYHKEPLLAACKAGVPYVISEKPLTTTLADALEVQAAAAASGTQIKVLFPNRFYPLDQAIRLLVAEGYLGRPQYGEMRMDDSIEVPLSLWGADSKKYASISSPAYFLFSHSVDLLHFYFGKRVKKVYAIGAKGSIGSEVDYLDGFLTFEDGMTIRLKTEWTKRMETLVENYVQLTASDGGFTFNKTPGYGCAPGLRLMLDGGGTKVRQAKALLEQNGIHASVVSFGEPARYGLDLLAAEGNDFDWNHGVCIYADSFGGEEPALSPLTDLTMGIEQVRVVEALLTSAKEGREILL